ncbi:hypothetical protein LA76x_2601 [Lysobacter antibioticus]|uniref:Uncharacterized protein n=1 Tax=Lysobacter antibioticus TaxID=84531 RepID=A0A0S2FB30_LYSAN|nr:hypothetical protein LA76x_2601 [Lysobacter antibioticus]
MDAVSAEHDDPALSRGHSWRSQNSLCHSIPSAAAPADRGFRCAPALPASRDGPAILRLASARS